MRLIKIKTGAYWGIWEMKKDKKKQALFTVDWLHDVDELNDPNKEFEDFGEFKYVNKNMMGCKTLLVHFETKEDFDLFVKKMEIPISIKAKYVWFPYKKRERYEDIHK